MRELLFEKITGGSIFKELSLFLKNNKRLGIENFFNYRLLKKWASKNKNLKREKPKKIEKIIFFGKDLKGTLPVNGFQPAKILRERNIDVEVCFGKLPKQIDNCLIIFVKYFPYKEVIKAIKSRCILAYNILDDVKPGLLENERKFCDGIIFPNKRMKKDFKDYFPNKTKKIVMYHHWDPRWEKIKKKTQVKKFTLVYVGSNPEKNAIFSNAIPRISFLPKFSDQLKTKGLFNFHYSMRKENSVQFLYKPSTKVSTAAAAGANIITSREPSAVELLGEDYPYYAECNLNSIKKTIDFAKKTLGGKVWINALRTMEKVKKKTNIEKTVEGYIELMNHKY